MEKKRMDEERKKVREGRGKDERDKEENYK